MASPPPLLPTPPASLKLRDTDAVDSRTPKRHRPLEPPTRPEDSGSCRHREPSPPPSSRRRAGGTPPPPKVRRRSRSPPYVSSTQRIVERPTADPAVEGEMARPSSVNESLVENRPSPSYSQRNCKHPETSSVAVEKTPVPGIRGDEQHLDCEKMDRKNQSDGKAPSRSARRKKIKRQAIKEMMERDPSRNGSPKTTKRHVWAEAKKEFREMKKDKLLKNTKKLQSCVWLLEKDGADMAEIMEFRSMLESTKKEYVENEAQLAKEGSSAPLQVLIRDKLEKTDGLWPLKQYYLNFMREKGG